MKEKYEHEIRELENSEKGLKDKYIEARTRLAESDANSQNLKAVVTQMELQLSHSTKVCIEFQWLFVVTLLLLLQHLLELFIHLPFYPSFLFASTSRFANKTFSTALVD